MRLSDLIGSEVLDREGHKLGQVHDVRLVQDGPLQGEFGAAFRVEGLVAGAGSIGTRLGFDRASVKGPWPLKAFFRWLRRDSRFVEWSQIASIEPHLIRLRVASDEVSREPAGDR